MRLDAAGSIHVPLCRLGIINGVSLSWVGEETSTRIFGSKVCPFGLVFVNMLTPRYGISIQHQESSFQYSRIWISMLSALAVSPSSRIHIRRVAARKSISYSRTGNVPTQI